LADTQNQTSTISVGLLVTVIGIIIATISVVVTLLIHNMEEVRGKADKADAADRWTSSMERIKQECEVDKEFLRDEREKQRDTAAGHARDALSCQAKYEALKRAWELHKTVCKCGHE